MLMTTKARITLCIIIMNLMAISMLHAQVKSYLVEYDGYQYAGGNEYKTIDTRTTVLIQGSFSYSFDSSLPVTRPFADSGNIYAKMTKARQVYKNRESKTLVFVGRNHLNETRNYPISDSLFDMNWYFTSQRKTIGELPCQKAIALWRGRAYSAWFTEEIAIAEGPWKFGGLPGLIVELYDEERDLYWKLNSFREFKSPAIEIPQAVKTYDEVVRGFKLEANRRIEAAVASMREINPGCKTCNDNINIKFPTTENWADH